MASGVLALVVAAAALVPVLRPVGWDVTALPKVDSNTALGAIARRLDPTFHTVNRSAYDGQFYWGVAIDPLATNEVHRAFDKPSYRYGHPLYGWLGWLFSAGHARAAAGALLAVGLVSLATAAALGAWLGRHRGSGGWESVFVIANAGLLYSAAHDLAEPLCVALIFGALAAYLARRRATLLVLLALLPLAKEPLALLPVALAAWELWQRRASPREVAPLLATLAPAVAWWIYARTQFGAWFTSGDTALGAPFAGWRRALLDAGSRSYSLDPFANELGEGDVIVLAALLGLLLVAGICALRLRGPVELLFIPLGVIAICLAPNATTILRDALRNTSLLVALVPFVIASPPLLPTWSEPLAARSSTGPPRWPT